MTMASRMAIMNKGQFVQIGSPESIYEHPNSQFSAKFVGTVNIFEGMVENSQNDSCIVRSQELEHPICINEGISGVTGVPVMIGVRPEKMTLSTHAKHSANSCTGVVEDIAYMGNQSIYHVRLSSGKLVTATLQNTTRLRKDMPTWEEKVTLSWDMESCVVLKI